MLVLDSADFDPNTYKEFEDILNMSYRHYVLKGGEHPPPPDREKIW